MPQNDNGMTVRELSEIITTMLDGGPKTAENIHAACDGRCTLYDVETTLRQGSRNGWYNWSNGLYYLDGDAALVRRKQGL